MWKTLGNWSFASQGGGPPKTPTLLIPSSQASSLKNCEEKNNKLFKQDNQWYFFSFLCRPQNTNTLLVLICKYASEEIVTSLGLLVSITYLLLQIHLLFPFHWNNCFRKRENLLRSFFCIQILCIDWCFQESIYSQLLYLRRCI